MSGGSFNYMYERIRENYSGEMYDHELNALLEDFCNVLHDLEWWQSGDIAKSRIISIEVGIFNDNVYVLENCYDGMTQCFSEAFMQEFAEVINNE